VKVLLLELAVSGSNTMRPAGHGFTLVEDQLLHEHIDSYLLSGISLGQMQSIVPS
jgi:hypothetical protein